MSNRAEANKDQEIRQSVSLVRSMLNGEMPVETYHRFKSIRPELLTTTEWLLVHMWETLNPVYEELVRKRAEVNSLKLEVKLWNQKCEKFNDDLMMVQKAVDQKDEINKRHVADHRRERQRLMTENDKLFREVQFLREAQQETLTIRKQNKHLLDEKDILVNKVNLLMPIDSDHPETEKRVHDIEVEKNILRKENAYLEKKDIQMNEEKRSTKLRIQELEKENQSLKETNEQYLHRLLQTNQKTETEYYKKLQDALDKQKLHHYEDLVRQRDNLVSEYDARLSLYKDQRDEAELQLKSLQREHLILKVSCLLT